MSMPAAVAVPPLTARSLTRLLLTALLLTALLLLCSPFSPSPPRCAQLLALYSSMHSSLLDSFNSTEADNKMSFIIQDLRLLLQNLIM